jgi:DnaJ-class molecular chaperone
MTAPLIDDYYALLGTTPSAGAAELRRAWRRLALRWHPDRAGHAATATFQLLSNAYEVLSDPLRRAAYDRQRRGGERARPAPPPQPARRAAPGVMLRRITGPLNLLISCGAVELEDDGTITLMLREDEAAHGGMATISMRVDLWCPDCAKPAHPAHPAPCRRCGGSRKVEELYSAWLAVPPGVAAGEILAPSVDLPGMIEPVRFRVHIHPNRKS